MRPGILVGEDLGEAKELINNEGENRPFDKILTRLRQLLVKTIDFIMRCIKSLLHP